MKYHQKTTSDRKKHTTTPKTFKSTFTHMQKINTSATVNLECTPWWFPLHTQVTEWLLFYPACDMGLRQRCPLFGLPTTDMFSTATEWGNPQGHSGFSPDMKRNVHPSKKISQDPVKADHLLRKLIFLWHLQPSFTWGCLTADAHM